MESNITLYYFIFNKPFSANKVALTIWTQRDVCILEYKTKHCESVVVIFIIGPLIHQSYETFTVVQCHSRYKTQYNPIMRAMTFQKQNVAI